MAATRSTDGPKPGLRERKKARTRAAIREHALKLFREQGYAATTVEQIAEAAEVSPSTFFRYFPTKEDLVLQDDFDALMFEAFERQPAGLSMIAALRRATAEALASISAGERARLNETAALTLSVPEIRARAPDDLAARTVAGAVIGVIMSATLPWTDWTDESATKDMFQRIDDALALLEA